MFMMLSQIATISQGISLRTSVEPIESGNVSLVQMRDLTDQSLINSSSIVRIRHSSFRPEQVVKKGDLLFRSRGAHFTAALVQGDFKNLIAASPLIKITPNTDKVLPAYLCWWISSIAAQSYFLSRAMGTSVKMINKKVLEELPVSIPSLSRQADIAELYALAQREKEITQELLSKKERYVQEILVRYASESRSKASHKKPRSDAVTSNLGQ